MKIYINIAPHMFQSSTIIRELALNLARFIYLL